MVPGTETLWTRLLEQSPYLLILAVFAFAVWKSVRWLGLEFLKPLGERLIKFIDDLDSRTEEQNDWTKQQTQCLQDVATHLAANTALFQKNQEHIENNQKILEDMSGQLSKAIKALPNHERSDEN